MPLIVHEIAKNKSFALNYETHPSINHYKISSVKANMPANEIVKKKIRKAPRSRTFLQYNLSFYVTKNELDRLRMY